MAIKNRNTLKGYFETGKKPTEGQYANLIDSNILLNGENTGSIDIKGSITSTSITSSGIISTSANVVADQFVGDGRLITGITSSLINISAQTASLNSGSLLISGTLFHTSASSTILLGIETTGSIIPAGNGTYDLGSPTNYFKDTFVSRSHALNVTTTELRASNIITTNITASQHLQTAGYISSSELRVTGNITASGDISASGNIYSKGLLSTEGNSIFGNEQGDTHTFTGDITSSGIISASGAISASHFSGIFNGALSSSNQIKVAISGAFVAPSASISTRLTTAETELAGTLISSSDQIATPISGAFVAPSASISTRLTTAETELAKTIVSSSNQIGTAISGAFVAPSASISTRLTTAETELAGTLISSSAQIGTAISGAFTAPSSSISTRLTTAETELAGTLISSSDQIATPISGAFTAPSASISTRLTTAETELAGTLISSSDQIATPISGAFTAPSASISTRLTTAETELAGTLISSSDQIAIPISGAFTAPSASISTRLTTAETELAGTLISSSDQIATPISGAFTAPSASFSTRLTTAETELAGTLISSSDQIATPISGAFVAPSASISTRLTTAETELAGTLVSSSAQIASDISGALSNTAIAALGGGYYSSSLQTFTNITASGNISASGNIFANNISSIGTGSFGEINLDDDKRLKIGTGDDLQFYHNGSNSYIVDYGTGNLLIDANNLRLRTQEGGDYLFGVSGSYVKLFYDNAEKLATTSTGINITGAITASGDISASGDVYATRIITPHGGKIVFDNDDLNDQYIQGGDDWLIIDGDDTVHLLADTKIHMSSSKVGVGISFNSSGGNSPTANFHISGSEASEETLKIEGHDGTNYLTVGLGGHITASGNISSSGEFIGASANITNITSSGQISSSGTITGLTGSFIEGRFTGNVGIGTTAPVSPLHVSGGAITLNNNQFFRTEINGAYRSLLGMNAQGDVLVGTNSGGDIRHMEYKITSGKHKWHVNGSQYLELDQNLLTVTGDVSASGGIITQHITASGNISASGIIFASKFESAGTAGEVMSFNDNINLTGHLTASGDISASGTIIGLTGSYGKIIISGSQPAVNASLLTLTASPNGAGEYIELLFSSSWADRGSTAIRSTVGAIATDKDLVFLVDDGAGLFEGMRIEGNGGKVGIGTATPDEKLTVAGNISASGNLILSHITASGNISSSGTITSNVMTPTTITNVSTTHITASGHISASGDILGTQALKILGDVSFNNVKPRTIETEITGEITASNSSKQITGSGTLFTSQFKVGDAFKITSASVEEIFTIEDIVDNFSMSLDSTYSGGSVTGSHTGSMDTDLFNIITSDNKNKFKINKSGDVTTSGIISSSGDITGSNIYLSGDIKSNDSLGSASFGRVDATNFHGDGAGLTGVTAEWDGTHVGTAKITGSLGMSGSITQEDGNITTDYINVEKAYMPGQGVGTMQIGSTFGVGETLDVVGNIHASNKVLANLFITNDSTTGVVGMISSSAQIATEISGAFENAILTNINVSGSALGNHITASGNISSSGTVYASGLTVAVSGSVSPDAVFKTTSDNDLNVGFYAGATTPSLFQIKVRDQSDNFVIASDTNDIMNISGSGNVGIGNLTPPETLTVEGNISSSGNIITQHITASGQISADSIANVNTTFVTASIVSSSTHIVTPKVKTTELESTASIDLNSSASITLKLSSSIGSTAGGNLYIKDGAATQIHITGSEIRTTSNMVLSSSGDMSLMADGNDITLGGDGKGFLKYTHDYPGTDDVTIANLRAGNIFVSSSNAITLDAAGGNLFIKDNAVTTVTINTTAGHITASGNISASGTIYASDFQSAGASGDMSFNDNINLTGHLTASGNISSSGTVTGLSGSYGHLKAVLVPGPGLEGISIYPDGTNSYLESNFNNLVLQTTRIADDIILKTSSSAGGPTTKMFISSSGRVGIGTSTPGRLFTIASGSTQTSNGNHQVALSISQTNTTANNRASLIFDSAGMAAADITAKFINHTSNYADLGFNTRDAVGWSEKLTIASAGNVGIGDITPSSKLDVAGNINTTSHITASGNISASKTSTITGGTGSFGILSGSIISGAFVGDGSGLTGAGAPAGTISSSYYYNTFQLSGSETYTSGSTTGLRLGLAVTGSILPGITSDGTTGFDLGSPTKIWRDLWLSPASLKFVSASGEITRFEQKDAKNLREGKPLELEAAVEGFTKLNRPEAVMSAATDKTYMDLNSAGRFKFKVGDNSTTPVNLMDMRYADGGNTVAKNYFKLGQGTTDIHLSGSFITTNANITASAVNSKGGNISASGTITGESGSFNQLKVSTVIGGSPVTFTDNIIVPNISASGIISSSTTIQGLTGSFVYFVAPTLSNVNSSTHVTASGNISASGKIYAEDFYIGNEQFTDNSAATGNFNIGASGVGSLILKHITASGNISGSAVSNISTGGDITGFDLISRNDITASRNISASGYGSFTGTLRADGNVDFNGDLDVDGTTNLDVVDIDGAVNMASTLIVTSHITSSGNISSSGNLSTTGNLTITGKSHFTGDITASGNISASGTIYADNFESTGGDDAISFTDNISLTGHLTASGNISASGHITNTGNITNTGYITTKHVTASGNISSSGTIKGLTGSFSHIAGVTSFGTLTSTTSSRSVFSNSTGVINSSVTFVPNVTNTFDLGSSTKQFKDLYIDGNAYIDSIAETVAITTASFAKVSSSLLPTIDNTWSLGASGMEWKDLYIDGTGNIDVISSSAVEVLAVATTASLHTSGAYSKVILESLPTITNGATTVVMNSSGQLFQSSNISASGFISTQTSVTASIVSASSTVKGISGSFIHLDVLGGTITSSGNIINTGYVSTTNITASGNISSSGNISATTGTGSFGYIKTSGNVSSSGTIQGLTGSFGYAIIPNISSSGTITVEHLYSSDDAQIADTLTVGTIANVNTTHITASGNISASGTIYAQNIIYPSSSEDLGNTATASLSTYTSYFSTGQAETANLEDGVEGQTKVLAMRSDGGNMVVTVSNAGWKTAGDGQITFDTLGDACTLQFINGHWFCIGNNGCTFA